MMPRAAEYLHEGLRASSKDQKGDVVTARFKVYENPANGYQEKVKDGFNWWVFIFGPLWYLFNGMALQGLGWFLVAALAGFFTLGIGAVIVWIIAGAKANADKEKKYLRAGWKFIGYENETIKNLQTK